MFLLGVEIREIAVDEPDGFTIGYGVLPHIPACDDVGSIVIERIPVPVFLVTIVVDVFDHQHVSGLVKVCRVIQRPCPRYCIQCTDRRISLRLNGAIEVDGLDCKSLSRIDGDVIPPYDLHALWKFTYEVIPLREHYCRGAHLPGIAQRKELRQILRHRGREDGTGQGEDAHNGKDTPDSS